MNTSNREAWLVKATNKYLVRVFKHSQYKLPKVKISVGFPGGRGSKKAIGQHWVPEASDDKIGSVFVSPVIDDSIEVLSVLVHELVHAAVGNKYGHGPVFKKCALAVGLQGKMRTTEASPALIKELKAIIKVIGKYPHAKLNVNLSPIKKQTTRMVKLECLDCGYIARASRSVILEKGPTLCPCNRSAMSFELEDF